MNRPDLEETLSLSSVAAVLSGFYKGVLLMTITSPKTILRYDWKYEELEELHDRPVLDLVHQAAIIHRENFDPTHIR